MATIEQVAEIKTHPNADKLELAMIKGFQCVVPKGVYTAGDIIVFIQPDHVLPTDAPGFEWANEYRKYAPKRIKAIKIRDCYSEGIILKHHTVGVETQNIGTDVSDLLGITKYVSPDEGDAGNTQLLPYGLPKTDEPRFETINLNKVYGQTVDISLKIDGQSMTVFYHLETDTFGICSRRLQIPLDSSDPSDKRYIAHVQRYDLNNRLRAYCKSHNVSLALRGESFGSGIQNFKMNPHCKMPAGFAVFSVFVIGRGYSHKGDPFYFVDVAKALDIPYVPILEENVQLTPQMVEKYSTGINTLENGHKFEGVVCKTSTSSFKIINKYYDSQK